MTIITADEGDGSFPVCIYVANGTIGNGETLSIGFSFSNRNGKNFYLRTVMSH